MDAIYLHFYIVLNTKNKKIIIERMQLCNHNSCLKIIYALLLSFILEDNPTLDLNNSTYSHSVSLSIGFELQDNLTNIT